MSEVRETWGKYAPSFAAEQADAAKRPSMQRLVELAALPAGSLVLDVATGAGFTAFAFADAGCRVVCLDPTHEMLEASRAGWADRKLPGPAPLVEAWAEALPFAAGAFDAVVSHRAPHQFADRDAFAADAKRTLKRGGLLGVADQSPPDGFERWHNDFERLRDPTHANALSRRQWHDLVTGAGFDWEQDDVVYQHHDLEDWMDRVSCPDDRRPAVREMLARAPEAYAPHEEDGRTRFRTPQLVFVARVH